ncbi:uncharacterized protein BDR25DRAFT_271593 [Lindgomyces ingoldianus]|uniref:Integral membrane protein n=1 Tax=Lindgomyces ingoldianus TaxID=673940 RepID=A0ACB6QDL3_9PLEO|nr:uncharacterized protein BDR25DRAFT_271593 [Lindgomyces ingoldianus]KAF2464590.1 integral membrane protein [Lindgomyces ingoldianus]
MTAESLTCKLEGEDTVCVGGDLHISFRRTIRVPDNHQASFLPPDLGAFPLSPVSRYADKLAPNMAVKGGLFFPMHQSEAMWINLHCTGQDWHCQKYMIKIYVGGINAISGEPAVETAATRLRRLAKLAASKPSRSIYSSSVNPLQDYVVVPAQLWLDGIADTDGTVRQFVAMPFGSGYSVESQITGLDATGGIQIEVTPYNRPIPTPPHRAPFFGKSEFEIIMKGLTGKTLIVRTGHHDTVAKLKAKYEDRWGIPRDQQRLIFAGRQLEDSWLVGESGIGEEATINVVLRLRGGGGPVHEMSVAAGGKIKQVIAQDPDPNGWLGSKTTVFNIQIVNSAVYRAVTGASPPMLPLDARTYTQYGFPFFAIYEEPSGISGDFSLVQSVAQIDKEDDEEEAQPNVVPILSRSDGSVAMKSPSDSIVNPAGPLREFRTVADLQKEFENYEIADF